MAEQRVDAEFGRPDPVTLALPDASRSVARRGGALAFAVTAAMLSALWIGVCSAAPELIWQGARIAAHHVGRAELLAALLVGVILAFFVEPGMERARELLSGRRHGHATDEAPLNPLFIACLSLAFAFVSVCLHEAMTAFVAERGADTAQDSSGLAAAVEITVSWAIVPACVTLAWLGAHRRWLAIPLGLVAAASSVVAGWVFAWGVRDTLTTVIPCTLILVLGYRQAMREPRRRAFTRCARSVALVAAVWLGTTLALDSALDVAGLGRFRLYTPWEFGIDVRFYLGWALGLAFAPFPFAGVQGRKRGATRAT